MKEIQSLPGSVVSQIHNFITENKIQSDPLIKDSIFNLLEQHCTVLYYPQENEDNDGCHVQRLVNNKLEHFVYINTQKSIEKQVFTAAHELGHILKLDAYLKDNCPEYKDEFEENAMNRFAAAILMPERLFLKQVIENYKNYSNQDNSISLDNLIKFSIYLMDYFFVPFKAVIIRLFEIGLFSKKDAEHIISDKGVLNQINDYIINLGYKRLGIKSNKKSIKDYAELLDKVEEKQIFNSEKISVIRKKMEITAIKPENISIKLSEPKAE